MYNLFHINKKKKIDLTKCFVKKMYVQKRKIKNRIYLSDFGLI
jgi:hypothetical protein